MEAIGNTEDMLFFPYNSEMVQVEPGVWGEDRLYNSRAWADYFAQFIGNGVYPNPANGLMVSATGGMVIRVNEGAAFAKGRFYLQKTAFDYAIPEAHVSLTRRDIVICRHDIVARTMQVYYVAGVPASIPLLPEIVRTDDVFDLKLAEITVSPGVVLITAANILDTRLNTEVCGIVHGLIDQVDTTAIFQQYQQFLNENIGDWENIKNEQVQAWTAQTEVQQTQWSHWWAEAQANPANYFQRNFDNPIMYPGCSKWTSKTPTGGRLETIRIGTEPDGQTVASRETYTENGAEVAKYEFHDLMNGTLIGRYIERREKIGGNMRNYVIKEVL